MQRRTLLATVGTAGVAATAGCGLVRSDATLSDPTVHTDAPGHRALVFTEDGQDVASFGVDGGVSGGVIDLGTELWHRSSTRVHSIALQVWMPEAEPPADVAVVSPVEGDSSPPPEITLSTPDRGRGTEISVTDLDDLADETIATLDLLVKPRSETATTLAIDCRIELANGDWFGGDYTLTGRLDLDFPDLHEE